MQDIVQICQAQGQETRAALTMLAGLADLQVLGYERDERAGEIVWLCEVNHEMAVCPRCQKVSGQIHEYQVRVKRDLAVFGLHSYLEYKHRRFWCDPCSKPFTEQLQDMTEGGRYTQRYEAYIYRQYKENSIREIQRQEGLGYKAAEGIFYRQAAMALEPNPSPLVTRLGIDEISLKKRHQQFILVISDLTRNCVIAVLKERHKETLEAWFDQLTNAQRQAITEVSMDMWSPYRQAVEAKLPQAHIVADRFHLMQNLNRTVTSARRELQRNAPPEHKEQLKGSRWLLVKNQEALSDQEQEKLDQLYALSPELKQLHLLKEAFRDIFQTPQSRDDAVWALADWIDLVGASGQHKLDTFIHTLENWAHPILNFFNHRTTQGFVEGMNNKLKLIMRRGYGYRNFDRFALRILAECGTPFPTKG
jgi:transposase